MNYQDRLNEANKLESDNHALLSTPLLSEGNISPMQVGMFSPRQKAKWQKDVLDKMVLQAKIKSLRRTDDEITECDNKLKESEKQSRICQLNSQINTIKNLGRMSHKENGNLKPSYQRTLDIAEKELKEILNTL